MSAVADRCEACKSDFVLIAYKINETVKECYVCPKCDCYEHFPRRKAGGEEL